MKSVRIWLLMPVLSLVGTGTFALAGEKDTGSAPTIDTGVSEGDYHVYWGAIHEHSELSRSYYGFTAEHVYYRMITEADLDFGVVTDYDWSLYEDDRWNTAKVAANRFHCPSSRASCYDEMVDEEGFEELADLRTRRFVTLLGFEWNNGADGEHTEDKQPMYGHRNLYYYNAGQPEANYGVENKMGSCLESDQCLSLYTSGDPEHKLADGEGWGVYRSTCELWTEMRRLRESTHFAGNLEVISIAHHPALSVTGPEGMEETGRAKPQSTDWSYHPTNCEGLKDYDAPEVLEPLVEIYSVWGSAEHDEMSLAEDPTDGIADAERVIRNVALSEEPRHKLGFVGAGDSHYGYPGLDPHTSFLKQSAGDFRNHVFECADAARCSYRFGHTGLLGLLVPAVGASSADLNRENIWEAMNARRTVATTGERFELRVDLVKGDDVIAIQGQDIAEENALNSFTDAYLDLQINFGGFVIGDVYLYVLDESGEWSTRKVLPPSGHHGWEGQVPLVRDGALVDWMPESPVMLYVRAQARKVGAIKIEEDANTFDVTTAHGKTGTIRVPAGRYTGTELATLIESRASKLPLAGAQLLVAYNVGRENTFVIRGQNATGGGLGVRLGFADSPKLAEAMGYRDDVDTPRDEGEYCTQCVATEMVEGRYITEAAWASPIWFSYDAEAVPPPKETADTAAPKPKGETGETGETGSPGKTGETGTSGETADTGPKSGDTHPAVERRFCGCGVAGGWPGILGLVFAFGWVRRRRSTTIT